MSGVVDGDVTKNNADNGGSGTELARLVRQREEYMKLEEEYEQLVDAVVAAKHAQETSGVADSGRLGAGVAAAAEKRVNDLYAQLEVMQQKLLETNISELEARIGELGGE